MSGDKVLNERNRQLLMFKGVDDSVISSLFKDAAAQLKRYGRQETVFAAQREVLVIDTGGFHRMLANLRCGPLG